MSSESLKPELEAYKCDCGDYESVISPSAYLASLLEYVTEDGSGDNHVTYANGNSLADLQNTFYQPFDNLAATTEAAQETVRHVRLCVEVLLGFLEDDAETGSGEGIPARIETAEYRVSAYEALLDQWGVTREDLRSAAYNEDEREWIAESIGVPESTVADLWLDPDSPLDRRYDYQSVPTDEESYPPSEVNLEDLFGLPALTKSADYGRTRADPLRTIEEPYVRIWRTRYLQNSWKEEDHPSDAYPIHLHAATRYDDRSIDGGSTRPIVDPDLLGPGDFRVIPDSPSFSWRSAFPGGDSRPPFELWVKRREWLDGELKSIWKAVTGRDEAADLSVVEVRADSQGSDSSNLREEYVVFENVGGEPLDLTGYNVEDDANHTYEFPADFVLKPGATVTLRTGSGTDTSTDLYWGSGAPIWNNSGDTVSVFDDQDSRVLSKVYSEGGYDRLTQVLNDTPDEIPYASRTGRRVWYPALGSDPPEIPATPDPGASGSEPFAGFGFLADFGRLYRQLTGDTETAEAAREARTNSQYPTADAEESPVETARTVVEEQLHLPERAFVRLVDLLRKYYADEETVNEEELWEITAIVAGARKRSLFEVWIEEERSDDWEVHLDRKTFWQPRREPRQGEWSFRLDRHDPVDPGRAPEPFVDPERMPRSELPEQPRGETAHRLYEDRQQQLQDKREEFTRAFETRRRELQSEFESLVATHDGKLDDLRQQIPDGGPVPDQVETRSPIDPILEDEFGSVSWPDGAGDSWEARFAWLHEGLQLAKRQDRGGSTLSNDEIDHVQAVEQQVGRLRASTGELRQLHTLREQSKFTAPDDGGLTPEQLADMFAALPLGNPLDPVLTEVYDSKDSTAELQPIYAETPVRWNPLFDDVVRALEGSVAGDDRSDGQGSGPAELAVLGLTPEEFESVLSLRRRARPGPNGESPPEAHVSEVIELLTSAWKRNVHYTFGSSGNWLAVEDRELPDYWDAYKMRLPKWRATAEERAQWQRALSQRSSAPLVEPDIVAGVDDFEPPAWEKAAFDLWNDRTEFLAGRDGTAIVSEIEQLRQDAEQGNRITTSNARDDIDTALRRTVGVPLAELRAIAERMEQGDDVGTGLGRLDLTPSALTYVLEIDDNLGTQPIRVEEWASLANILLGVWKRRQYGRWNREERAHGVLLEPDQFDLPDPEDEREPPGEDDPLRWRVDWSIREEWEDILETRVEQLDGVDEEIEEAVAAAEREALPTLRETLIEHTSVAGQSAFYEEKAEWLSERLLVDMEMHGGRETTRTSQAITSLQTLVQSIDLGFDEQEDGLAALGPAILDEQFDQRWQWLGTYARWKAAMGVYLYPENAVLPTLRRRTTEAFDEVARSLTRNRNLTSGRAMEIVERHHEYLADVMSLTPLAACMAPGPVEPESPQAGPEGALSYVIAESEESDTCYLLAFDPAYTGAQRHEDSTWSRIPVEELESASEVHGATTYEETIYVFFSTEDEGSGENEGGESSDGDSSSLNDREQTLQYVRYNLGDDEWTDTSEIELPEEIRGVYVGADRIFDSEHEYTTELGEFWEVEVVMTTGWDSPPELHVVLQSREYAEDVRLVGPDVDTGGLHLFVPFDEDGNAPNFDGSATPTAFDVDDEYGATANSPSRTIALGDSHRAFFTFGTYHLVDIEDGSIEQGRDYDEILPRDRGLYLRNVVYRPDKEYVLLIPQYGKPEVIGTWSNRLTPIANTYDEVYWPDHINLKGIIQCNNVTELSDGASEGAFLDAGNEVLVGSGGSLSYGDSIVPSHVRIHNADGTLVVDSGKPLVPAIHSDVGTGFRADSWLYGPRPDESGKRSWEFDRTISHHAKNVSDIRRDTTGLNLVYVDEAYYYLPLLVARQLTSSGEYEAALEWFRTIYDYTGGLRGDTREIWPPLKLSSTTNEPSRPGAEWLLDPINPHAIAETRANTYRKFTLFSLIRCLSDYADDEFAQDTPQTVANATDLYEQALDLLDKDVFGREEDPCTDLIENLERAIAYNVIFAAVWEDEPGLSRAEVEAKTDELVRIVKGIDDYTDRKEAVTEIREQLESGELTRALDVANEWEEREQGELTYEERLADSWLDRLSSRLSRLPELERQLVGRTIGVDWTAAEGTSTLLSGLPSDGETGSDEPSSSDEDVEGTIDRLEAIGATIPDAAIGVDPSRSGDIDRSESGDGGVGLEAVTESSHTSWFDESVGWDLATSNIDAAGLLGDGGASVRPALIGSDTGIVDTGFGSPTPGADLSEAASTTVDAATMDILKATKHQFCIPENPLLASLRRHAEVNLEKIRSGRNIAGMKRELDPYASPVSIESAAPTPGGAGGMVTAGGQVQPTNYRYETLLERAKELADRARQFEAELLSAIEKAENEEFKLKKARQQVEFAEERVSLQEVRVERAESKVELARLRREKARIRRDTYTNWINNPLVDAEQQVMSTLQSAMLLQNISAVLHAVAGRIHVGAAITHAAAAGVSATPGSAVSSAAAAASSAAAAVSSAAAGLSTRAGALSTRAQIEQIRARKQRRLRRWDLKKSIASQNFEIGTQRVEIARKTVDIVRQEREIAELRADHAEDIVNFHENKFTNEELYQWIADVLEGVYRYFLQQAASVAKMAQRQLSFERQGLPRKFVKSDYSEAPTQGQTVVPAAGDSQDDGSDRRGLTGSARLLRDIYELEQHEFRSDQRRLQVEKTVSVAELDPLALQRFCETGVLSFATTLEDFDVDHPGHYHRMIEDVDVTIVALTPPTEGINATLRNSGTSRIVVGETLFREKRIDRDPETIVLNRARGRERDNEVRLRPRDREKLRPFEHSGVATDWELEMPRPANDMDYGTIVDVQLTVEYSALESYDYRQQVISDLDPERTVERNYSFHDDFGDAWYELNNAPADATSTTVRFETERDDFPSNLFDLSLERAQLYFVVSAPNRADKREDLKDLKVELASTDGSGTKSKATNGTVDAGVIDADDPNQEWELIVTPTDIGDPFTDGTIEDVLFIVTAEGETGNWPP